MDACRQTVGEELGTYAASANALSLAGTTQQEYQRVIAHLVREVGNTELTAVNRRWLRGWRDKWAISGHRAATIRLQVLRNALAPAIDDAEVPADLFVGLMRVDRPHGLGEANPIWTDNEVQAVIKAAIERDLPGLARAVGLARYAGFRRRTICDIPVSARIRTVGMDGQLEHRIRYLTEKGEVFADKPEDPLLTQLLDVTPSRGSTIAYNGNDLPFRPRGLNQTLDRLLVSLARQGLVRERLTLHGLRHARGVELANSGASDAVLMAQLEHTDEQSARVYRRQATRIALADLGQELITQRRAAVSRQAHARAVPQLT